VLVRSVCSFTLSCSPIALAGRDREVDREVDSTEKRIKLLTMKTNTILVYTLLSLLTRLEWS
jgi:hypothetical protein